MDSSCIVHTACHLCHGSAWMYIESPCGRISQKAQVANKMKPGVVNCQIGWWIPEETEKPYFGCFEVNANVLTTTEPPFDPCMGTYKLRGLLRKISPHARDEDYCKIPGVLKQQEE